MLKYIEETTADNVTNPTIAAVDNLVSKVKHSREDFQYEQLRRTIFSGSFYSGIHS